MFEALAQILNFFYELVPNYAIAIAMMTLLVMVVTTPLTLKGTRSMIKLQMLQPELKRIQTKHKDDRQTLNEEMMKFYQENQVNPVGGCLPLLVQAPVFFILFRLIRGLTSRGDDGTFDPDYLEPGQALFEDLDGATEMVAFGLDLSESTTEALGMGIVHGIPYVLLILLMAGLQYFQQYQVQARNPDGSVGGLPQQQMILRIMPAFFAVISIGFPAALVVYWLTSSAFRIGLQAYITKTLYGADDSLGRQAQQAAAEARKIGDGKKGEAKKGEADSKQDSKSSKESGAKKRPAADDADERSSTTKGNGNGRSNGNGRVTSGSSGPKPHPKSKKKKRKRR